MAQFLSRNTKARADIIRPGTTEELQLSAQNAKLAQTHTHKAGTRKQGTKSPGTIHLVTAYTFRVSDEHNLTRVFY